ncbi:DsbA family protein [Actinoallomurus purpureus]|uniref:DsbA family oxidoreductase n=1 Tax=Actinoallomurus purpureus TaxID=478114 RepID=UPI0020930F23|nr:DsbA family protein [Actinoallomurus purpureus]MCO6008091.1 DsbA family protein [Actinoallomurus purpureus]
MTAGGPLTVVEFTDPACPWAWGSEPKFRWLRAALDGVAAWRRVYGILFDDDDDPAPDPDAEAAWYHRYTTGIAAHTGAPYASRLRWVARSSRPASLAAKASEAQGAETAAFVLRRLRETSFLLGAPADDVESVLDAVTGVPGLDHARLARDLVSDDVRSAVRRDWTETREPYPEVLTVEGPGPHPGAAKEVGGRHRFALPTLVFSGPAGRAVVPGWRELGEYAEAAARVAPGLRLEVSPRTPAELLERHRSLTGPELALLAGSAGPPPGGVRFDGAGGPVWLHPAEAAAHPVSRL